MDKDNTMSTLKIVGVYLLAWITLMLLITAPLAAMTGIITLILT